MPKKISDIMRKKEIKGEEPVIQPEIKKEVTEAFEIEKKAVPEIAPEIPKAIPKEKKEEICCSSSDDGLSCCHVEGVAKVDAKGQIVLPKSLRDSMDIHEGDKLIVVGMREKGELRSISLFKATRFDNMVKILLKPVVEELLEEGD